LLFFQRDILRSTLNTAVVDRQQLWCCRGVIGEEMEPTDQGSAGDKLVTVYLPDNQVYSVILNVVNVQRLVLKFFVCIFLFSPAKYIGDA